MGRIYTLAEAQAQSQGQIKQWLYNTLDVTGTREIADTLLPRLNENQKLIYAFERGLQAPAFSMMMRGALIDVPLRSQMVTGLRRELNKDMANISKMKGIADVWDATELETGLCKAEISKHHKWPRGVADSPERKCERCGTSRVRKAPFNPNSTDQVKHLLYDIHKIKPMTNKKGEISVDGDVLDRIGEKYPHFAHITEAINGVKDKKKQLGSLAAKLTPDNRYPSSFNVGAAWTGRFSSSKNPHGLGGNLQNWAERHRACLIPDHGYDLAYVDLKQAESNLVAHLADDEKYIEAHRSGDVHTYVTRLVWPSLPWTGDMKADKKIAKQNPAWDQAPGHDFRFQAKRIQHGSNYGLTPRGIAMIARIPMMEATIAQRNYFTAFPGIRAWQNALRAQVHGQEALVNIIRREIRLFGRPWDEHTFKQGLSFKPQSGVADILDTSMWRIWDAMDPHELHLLAQVHDALLLQFLTGRIDIIRRAANLMRIPVPVLGRTLIIEPEVAVGKNWGHKNKDNPNGIEELEI